MKKWFDDWNITHYANGDYEVSLPNNNSEYDHIVFTKKSLSESIEWLISFLELALMELTKKMEIERGDKI